MIMAQKTTELTMFILPSCPHCKLALSCLSELQKDERYRSIRVHQIDESREPKTAEQYDYYFVPSFFLGDVKLFEGHMEMEDVKGVLSTALKAAG